MRETSILLMIGGGVAAYKTLELIRLLKKNGARVRVILTSAGAQFVTPLSVAALSGEKSFGPLFDLTDEAEIGHIRLAREADLIVVAPATADLMAKQAHGLANDLASTCLLAADGPVLLAPAMNPVMWAAAATRRNHEQLLADGVRFVGPEKGDMACGETGLGRMAEPARIFAAIEQTFAEGRALSRERRLAAPLLAVTHLERPPLAGRHVLVTAGPTHEPIDPVRYIANRSSGLQGYAIARAARELGAEVTLVSGPVALSPPSGVELARVETARQMLAAVKTALPADICICAAAVADWRAEADAEQKLKKKSAAPAPLKLVENPDILQTISAPGEKRPRLVIGFAAETEDLLENARAKLAAKGCDWLLANDVSPGGGVFGGDSNKVFLLQNGAQRQEAQRQGAKAKKAGWAVMDEWPRMSKREVAERLMRLAAQALLGQSPNESSPDGLDESSEKREDGAS